MTDSVQQHSGVSVETQGPFPKPELTVVGIGASAGGLAALKELFSRVAEDNRLAYVVVVHLPPEHESHLADLLQSHVPMSVTQVQETVPLEGNRVYLIPPNANLEAIDTHLRLTQLEKNRRTRAPIDHFFRTLANTQNGHAVGVILTGTGSDGTLGVKDIKEKGGLVVVQDPEEAEYSGMPHSAISTGMVDLILPLARIPAAILQYAGTEPRVVIPSDGEVAEGDDERILQKVFAQIRARTGRDFTRYKRSTILRRIARRMQCNEVEELPAYLELLRGSAAEAQALADDLLITVTHFFRDVEVFQKLETDIIPQLFEGKGPEDDLRVWSVGCATGEEAYSLAMLLLEEAGRREGQPRLQVFASDLHDGSLQLAREGFYSGDIQADISPERLRRFFKQESGGYRVRKEVRDMVLFAPHNLLKDPPFSRIDLVLCRNLLIYLQRGVQRDVLELIHYTLRPQGWLIVGTSESVDTSELFRSENRALRIFRKRDVPPPQLRLPVFPLAGILPGEPERATGREELLAYRSLHQRMVEQSVPPSMLIDPENRIVHLSEHAGRYLVHPGGELTSNVFKLVRTELRLELQALLHDAREQKQRRRSKPIPVRLNGGSSTVVLHARPALEPKEESFILVMFEEREEVERERSSESGQVATDTENGREPELEAELELSQMRMQAVIEESEAAQEEMRASNEEIQSANEELRSAMEELETSKEELQSMNEELQAVNEEKRHKVEELRQLSDDLQNLMDATQIATLFLDRDLRILRFTPQVGQLFNVRSTDRGRSISDLTRRLGYADLERDAQRVLRLLSTVEREVSHEDGRWYLARVLPYRSAGDQVEGIVLTYLDITSRKQAEEALEHAKRYAESIVETLHEPLLVLTPELCIKSANRAFYDHFRVSRADTVGRKIYEVGNGQWNIPKLRVLLEEVLPSNHSFNDFEVSHCFEEIGKRVMLLDGRRLDRVQLILLGIRDISDRKKSENDLRQLTETLEERVEERTLRIRELASRLTMAEQQERRRIARVLHDDLQQLLYGVEMKLMVARRSLPPDTGKVVEDAEKWIHQALETTRQLTVDFSPPVLQKEELAAALEWLQRQTAALHGLDVSIEAEQRVHIPDENLRGFVFQAVRELLFNVRKHAAADKALIRLEESAGVLMVQVIDEGRGFDVEAESSRSEGDGGFGLLNIRERLELLGGRLEIRSRPGEGTQITLRTPLSVDRQRAERGGMDTDLDRESDRL